MNPPPSDATDHPTPHQGAHAASRAIGRAPASSIPPRLADEFFYAAHDDRTGKPLLYPAALALGLAAALLAELYGAGRITFDDRHVRVTNPRPPQDQLQTLVDRLIAEAYTETRTWLKFVAASSYDSVAGRMSQLGLVQPRPAGFLRRGTRYTPTDTSAAFWAWARLSTYLSNFRPLEHIDVPLANLVWATGLSARVLQFAPGATTFLEQQAQRADPALRDLVVDLGAAVDSAVLYRTS